MIRVLLFLFVTLLLVSCGNRNNHLQLRALIKSLENSNSRVKDDCIILYGSIENKTKDPVTAQKASLWQPKVVGIKEMSRDLVDYIEGLKVKLRTKAASAGTGTTQTFDEGNEEVVKTVFIEQDQSLILQEKLNSFSRGASNKLLLSFSEADSFYVTFIRSDLDRLRAEFPEGMHSGNVSDQFKEINVLNALAMLTKYQNDVLLTEHALVSYSFRQIPVGEGWYQRFSVLTMLNTNCTKRGEVLEVTAGVGAFSLDNKPQITIDGKPVSLTADGVAVYEFKANKKPGKYIVPVRFEYTDYDGSVKVFEKKLRYTILD